MADSSVLEMPGQQSPETPPPFLAVPERIAPFVDLEEEEVASRLKSVNGRQELFNQLVSVQDDVRSQHPDFDPETARMQMDMAGESLQANELYLEDVQSPEKKGVFRRAWEAVKAFPRKHPVVTALLAAAAVAGGVAAGFYIAGEWEMLVTSLGLKNVLTMKDVFGGTVGPVTPQTPLLPGGGIYEVQPPLPGPGEPWFIPH